ncbi:MAG: hypothetical protein FWH22_08840 [Fibromonadales bacterium]|nr:hypothetical protein [Fibromonadales bacterium]
MRVINKIIYLLLLIANSFAWHPTPQIIEDQVPQTAFRQLMDFQNFARPEYNAYLTAGLVWLPLPSQSSLSTEWGILRGFAFRQYMGMWLTNNFDGHEQKRGLSYGIGWLGERQGWSNEDFLFFPHRGDFSQINQVHTFGLTIADSSKHLLFSGGAQYLNAEDETLRWWLLVTWGRFSIMPNFHKGDLQFINTQLHLQARELRGNRDSWQNYLPDLDFSFYAKDSVKIFVSQNLYKQKYYLESAFWVNPGDLAWVALKFYPDPSRLLMALEATATKKENNDIYFGGGITTPFLRVAYNHASDYDNFFKSRGIWIIEICLGIGTSGDSFFALKAPKAAPSKISSTPVKKQNVDLKELRMEN